MRHLLRLPLALLVALAAATGVHAQSAASQQLRESTILPVWNKGSGKVEAFLYLEPTGEQKAGARWHFGRNSLDAAFGLTSGDSLGLICNSSRAPISTVWPVIACLPASATKKTTALPHRAASRPRWASTVLAPALASPPAPAATHCPPG